jgi:hypothetical protein
VLDMSNVDFVAADRDDLANIFEILRSCREQLRDDQVLAANHRDVVTANPMALRGVEK